MHINIITNYCNIYEKQNYPITFKTIINFASAIVLTINYLDYLTEPFHKPFTQYKSRNQTTTHDPPFNIDPISYAHIPETRKYIHLSLKLNSFHEYYIFSRAENVKQQSNVIDIFPAFAALMMTIDISHRRFSQYKIDKHFVFDMRFWAKRQ